MLLRRSPKLRQAVTTKTVRGRARTRPAARRRGTRGRLLGRQRWSPLAAHTRSTGISPRDPGPFTDTPMTNAAPPSTIMQHRKVQENP